MYLAVQPECSVFAHGMGVRSSKGEKGLGSANWGLIVHGNTW